MSDFSLILDKEKTTEQMFKVCDYYKVKNIDIAEFLDTSEVEVSMWKSGKRFPGWDKIMLFAYTVGLPLEVMIIGKEKIENNQIKGAIVRIDELKEKKYISILQELLDSGKLDNPPKIEKVIFNPSAQYSSYNPNIKEIAGKP